MPALEGRQPAAQEQQRGQEADQDHVGVFGQEEDREGRAGVFDVEAGDDLRLALGDVEGRAVGLGHAGDEVDQEQREQREEEELEEAVVAACALTIAVRFIEPAATSTPTSAKPIAIS
jgi:hypothetical protein